MSKVKIVCCALGLLSLAGCNPYSRFYVDLLDGRKVSECSDLTPPQGKPILLRVAWDQRGQMPEPGYALIGYSSFWRSSGKVSNAKHQAREVGAAIVVVSSQYSHTATGAMPITTRNPDQTMSSYHTGGITGPSGYHQYSGTSQTTVPGGYSTYYVPYSVRYYNFYASYWVKRRTVIDAPLHEPAVNPWTGER